MNKLTKGAIAGAAGIILLMGGAGSLAYWSDQATLGTSGQQITAGSLKITANTDGAWTQNGNTVNLATFKAVPGDQLTYTQTFNVTAAGNNLYFTAAVGTQAITAVSTTTGSPDIALAAALTKSAGALDVTGSTIAASTTTGTYKVGAGTGSVKVSFTITFPFGTAADNATQLGKVNLGTGAVTLTQTQTP